MKKSLITLGSILVLAAALYANTVILEFSGEPSANKIILNWKTGLEENVNLFIVQRSTNNKDFLPVGEVAPTGSNSAYEFIDTNLSDVKTIFYYRLRIRNSDGTFQLSEPISVIPKISSFAKTWGSIKALFQ